MHSTQTRQSNHIDDPTHSFVPTLAPLPPPLLACDTTPPVVRNISGDPFLSSILSLTKSLFELVSAVQLEANCAHAVQTSESPQEYCQSVIYPDAHCKKQYVLQVLSRYIPPHKQGTSVTIICSNPTWRSYRPRNLDVLHRFATAPVASYTTTQD
jgi:hypothetical protein